MAYTEQYAETYAEGYSEDGKAPVLHSAADEQKYLLAYAPLVKRIVADIVTTHQQAATCQAATEKARGRDQSKAQAELDRTCDRLQDLVDDLFGQSAQQAGWALLTLYVPFLGIPLPFHAPPLRPACTFPVIPSYAVPVQTPAGLAAS